MKTCPANKKFGLGLDLSWYNQEGFFLDQGKFTLSQSYKNFFAKQQTLFDHFFFSLQPMNFDLLESEATLSQYFAAFDLLIEQVPHLEHSLSLHHTFLNLATDERDYPKAKIAQFTNKIIDRYNIKWVNEDLGLWMIKGKTLPYPLPPVLNTECLKECVKNIKFYQENLNAELYVEFPGFSEGHSFILGDLDGFEFFKDVVQDTKASVVIDTGHVLSYQWLKGNSSDYLKNLEAVLPLSNCKEIHLSGCSIVGEEFFDFHHGVIRDEQLRLLEFLIPKTPNLEIITFEDPKFDNAGDFIKKSKPNLDNLTQIINNWKKDAILH